MDFVIAQRKELRDRGIYVTSSLSSEVEAFLRFDPDDRVEDTTSAGAGKAGCQQIFGVSRFW